MIDDWNYHSAVVTGFPDSYTLGTSLVNNFVREAIRESFQEVLDKALGGEETSKYVLECTSKEETVLYLSLIHNGRRRRTTLRSSQCAPVTYKNKPHSVLSPLCLSPNSPCST